MMKSSILSVLILLTALLAAGSRADDAAEQTDRAFLLARRDFSSTMLKQGEKVTVTVDVFNSGSSDASDVSVEDTEWDTNLFETEGDITGSFDTIPAGVTKSFSYVIIPKVPLSRFEQPELTLSYNDGENTIASQGPRDYVKIYSKEEMLRKKILDVGSMATLGMITSEEQWVRIVVFCAVGFIVLVAFRLAKKLKNAMQSSKRKSALKEFGFKDE